MSQPTNHYRQTEAALYLYKRGTDAVIHEFNQFDAQRSLELLDKDFKQLLCLLGFETIAEAKQYVGDLDDLYDKVGDIEIEGITKDFDQRIKEYK